MKTLICLFALLISIPALAYDQTKLFPVGKSIKLVFPVNEVASDVCVRFSGGTSFVRMGIVRFVGSPPWELFIGTEYSYGEGIYPKIIRDGELRTPFLHWKPQRHIRTVEITGHSRAAGPTKVRVYTKKTGGCYKNL